MDESLVFQTDYDNMKTTDYVADIKSSTPKFKNSNSVKLDEDNKRNDELFATRAKLDASKLSWYSNDKQPDFNSHDYKDRIPYYDSPYGTNTENSDPSKICFEKVTKRSFYFDVIYLYKNDGSRWPMNPVGPTGLRGRGVLDKWGPNHHVHIIITRWKKNAKGGLCVDTKSMRPILEAIVFENLDEKAKSTFGANGYNVPNCQYSFGVEKVYDLSLKTMRELYPKIKNDVLENITQSAKRIYLGYVDDSRNTDNAWIETQCYNFHDIEDHLIDLDLSDDKEKYEWRPVVSNENFYPGLHELMRRLTKYHGAHF